MGGINRELAFLLDSRSFMSTNYNQSMYDRVKARPRRDCTDNESDKKKKKRRKKKKKLSRRHRLERQNRRNNKINEKFDEIENTEKHCTDEDMKEKIREIKRSISEFKANLSSSSCSSEDSSNSSDNSSGSDDDDSSSNSNSSSEKSSHSSNSLSSSSSSSLSDQDSDLETKSVGSDVTPSKRLKKSRYDRKSKSRLSSDDDDKQPDEDTTEFSVVDKKEKSLSSKAPLTLPKLSHNLELASNCSMSSAGSSSGHGTKRRQSNDEDLTFSSSLSLSSKKANLNTDNQASKTSRKRQKSNDSLFDSEECNVQLESVSVAASQLSPSANKCDEAKAVEQPKSSKPAVQSPKSIPSSKDVNVCKRQRVDSVTNVPTITKPATNVSNEETIVKKRKLTDDSSVKNSPAKPTQSVTQTSSAKPVSSNSDQNKVKKAAPVASSTTVKPTTVSNTKSASGLAVKKEQTGTPTPKTSSSVNKAGNEPVSANKQPVKVKPAVSSPCSSQVKAKEVSSTGETKKTSSSQVASSIKTDANKPSKTKTSSSSTTKPASVDSGAKLQSNQVAPTKVPTSSGSSKPSKQLKQPSVKETPVVASPVIKSDSTEHVLLMSAKSTLSSSSSSSIGGGIEDEPLTLSTIIKTESKNMQNNLKNKKMLLMMPANEEDEREVDQAVKSIFEATNKPIVNTVGLLSNETVKCEPAEEETNQLLDEENADMEEPCAARKTVSVDSSTPEVILSVLDQIKGEKVEVSQHDEEETEEPVIVSTEPMEERYDETHTTTETTEVEAAAIAILSCSQKMQVETVADASVLSAHEEEEAKPIEHVAAEETATASTVTGLELLTNLIEMKQQEEILFKEESTATKEEEPLVVQMDLPNKTTDEQRFCDDFVDMNKQQHDYLNETSESKDLPRETSEAVSVLLDLGLEKKLFPMPAYTGKKQRSKGSTSSTDSMSEFKSISSVLLPFSSDLAKIESSLSLLTNDAETVNDGMDQQAHFHMDDAQKLAVDKPQVEKEADEPQTASFHSPTMLVLNQSEQLEFNPSKMDLNATMSLSISLNNLNQIESSEHLSTESHMQNNASKQFDFEDTQHNSNSLMLNQQDNNEQSMQELNKQVDLNMTHQDNVPQSQQQSQLYELAFNMNTNSNINPEVDQNDQPLYKNTDSNVQDFGVRNKNLGKIIGLFFVFFLIF